MALGVYPLRGAKEAVTWLILGLVGVGGLAVAIAYGNALWLQRRKDWATKREQNETVRDNYRHGG
jgi:predicted outer membrane lipoprotein